MWKYKKVITAVFSAVLVMELAAFGNASAVALEKNTREITAETETTDSLEADYTEYLFDASYVHSVEVTIRPEDWEYMQENILEKPKYTVEVTVDGETFENVRFSPKGSSSLRDTASSTYYKGRYSYKFSFGSLAEGHTYHGLDSLSLNNSYEDPSCARDWLAYRLFNMAGVPAPCVSFTELYVNGELQGLYYAVENEGGSFLQRNGLLPSMTYMPEPEVLTKRNEQNADDVSASVQNDERFAMASPISADDVAETPGADLKYRGDDPANYTDIFENTFLNINEEDKECVIAALKAISTGCPEEGADTDEVIKYFAAHNFITSWDSYTGVMLHNYLLAEHDGLLLMIPWDYNLAFTSIVPVHTQDEDYRSGVIEMDIDDPGFQNVSGSDRPMWYWITQDESYLAQYHSVLTEIILPYFESGEFEADMTALRNMIRPYLEQDPTYGYGMEEFEKSFDDLIDFCLDRAGAVQEQLNRK